MIDKEKYKRLLIEESDRLQKDLSGIAVRDSESVGGWQAKGEDSDRENADLGEMADRMEELGDREALESTLESRLVSVNDALKRIADGSYGICEVGGHAHEIELERLDANIAAKTCLMHLSEELV